MVKSPLSQHESAKIINQHRPRRGTLKKVSSKCSAITAACSGWGPQLKVPLLVVVDQQWWEKSHQQAWLLGGSQFQLWGLIYTFSIVFDSYGGYIQQNPMAVPTKGKTTATTSNGKKIPTCWSRVFPARCQECLVYWHSSQQHHFFGSCSGFQKSPDSWHKTCRISFGFRIFQGCSKLPGSRCTKRPMWILYWGWGDRLAMLPKSEGNLVPASALVNFPMLDA